VPYKDFYFKIFKEIALAYTSPITAIVPILAKNNLVNPQKRLMKNIKTYRDYLWMMISECKDESSICYQAMHCEDIPKREVFEDTISLLLGGTETSSHALASILYYLKKYPKCYDKLVEEMEENGFSRKGHGLEHYQRDTILNMSYLNYVVRETLRLDCPTFNSLYYEAKEDITICGVDIPKGHILQSDIILLHTNPKEWHQPLEFIPERFDPESEFYFRPETEKKARSPYSFVPFSFGGRKCPGQAYALLEIKVALIFMLSHIDYDIDENVLRKDGVGFGLGSQVMLPFRVSQNFQK
jgi:cytochrome P450